MTDFDVSLTPTVQCGFGQALFQWRTDYLSLWPKPDFLNLRLRLRPPNFMAENLGLDKMVFFQLIDHKSFEMAFVLSLQSSYNRNSPK